MDTMAFGKLVGVEGSQAYLLPLNARDEVLTAPAHGHTVRPPTGPKNKYWHTRQHRNTVVQNKSDTKHSNVQSENNESSICPAVEAESSASANAAHTRQVSQNHAVTPFRANQQIKKRGRGAKRNAKRGIKDKIQESRSGMMSQGIEEDTSKGKGIERYQQPFHAHSNQNPRIGRWTSGVSARGQMPPRYPNKQDQHAAKFPNRSKPYKPYHQRPAKLKQVGSGAVKTSDQTNKDIYEQDLVVFSNENFDPGTTIVNDRAFPATIQSLPNTPDTVTFDEWKRLPVWQRYAPITHKEKLAIKTMETIPTHLLNQRPNYTVTTPTDVVSPRLLPLTDRMAFIFARVMAKARVEADIGNFTMCMPPLASDQSQQSSDDNNECKEKTKDIQSADVMSSKEVEAFCAGMQEVRDPDHDNRVIMRRYWRITEGLEDCDPIGGVIAACSKATKHVSAGFKAQAKKGGVDGVLLAEIEVKKDGTMRSGEWNAVGLGLSEVLGFELKM